VTAVDLVSACPSGAVLTTVSNIGEQSSGSGVFKYEIVDPTAMQIINFDVKIHFTGGSTCIAKGLEQ
jgi:hypothetical protein